MAEVNKTLLDGTETPFSVRFWDDGSGNLAAVHVLRGDGAVANGYQRLTSLSSATGLTPPSGASWARIYVEAGAVRFRDDGTAATTTGGAPWAAGTFFETYDPDNASLIETEASSIVTVEYF